MCDDESGIGVVGGVLAATKVQFFVDYGEGSTVVRCSPRSVLAHVVDLGGDAYAVCGIGSNEGLQHHE